MHSLQSLLACRLRGLLQPFKLRIGQNRCTVRTYVLFFPDRPLSVVVIEGGPIIVDKLLIFDFARVEFAAAAIDQPPNHIPKEVHDENQDEGCEHGPFEASPAIAFEDSAVGVVRQFDLVSSS